MLVRLCVPVQRIWVISHKIQIWPKKNRKKIDIFFILCASLFTFSHVHRWPANYWMKIHIKKSAKKHKRKQNREERKNCVASSVIKKNSSQHIQVHVVGALPHMHSVRQRRRNKEQGQIITIMRARAFAYIANSMTKTMLRHSTGARHISATNKLT